MPSPWTTVAPVQYYWHLPDGVVTPFQFAERVSLRTKPDWLESTDTLDLLSQRQQDQIKEHVEYWICVDYEADALGSPDPEWEGDTPRQIQHMAFECIQYVNLALWLVRPTGLNFDLVIHAERHSTEWLIRQIAEYDAFCPLPEYDDVEYTAEDFVEAQILFAALRKLSLNGTLRTAVQSTIRGLTERGWTLRFLVLWLVVESLFGPEDARETTFRLSQRVALFLTRANEDPRETFDQVKESYSWRSKVVHGLRLAKLTSDESQKLIAGLEDVVRRSLLAILKDETLASKFDSKGREQYLDELIFSRRPK